MNSVIKSTYKKLNNWFDKIDSANLGFFGIAVIVVLLLPILYLKKGAVFPVVDQLDEVILNTILTAKHFGADYMEEIMCGLPMDSMKPSSYFFVPLYMLLDSYSAFVIQYAFVIATAFLGTYLTVKKLSDSSIGAFLSATVFAMLPFRSIYGNCLSGFPLVIYCFLVLKEYDGKKNVLKKLILPLIGVLYITFSSNVVLNGYAAIIVLFVFIIIDWIKQRKLSKGMAVGFLTMFIGYLISNLDLLSGLFGKTSFESHRSEFIRGNGSESFIADFKEVFWNGISHNESLHKYIIVTSMVAIVFFVFNGTVRKKMLKSYLYVWGTILVLCFLYAFTLTGWFLNFQGIFGSMLESFQFQRFFYLLPGLWYVLFGLSMAVAIKGIGDKASIAGGLIALVICLPTLNYVARYHDGIFYMNVNQIRNSDITGYITWEKMYAEELMDDIKADIDKDITSYRVASIGITPAVALMNGFYTIDGYSNNYPLEYKHEFRKIIADELALSDYNRAYFDTWGSRCYLFYHEWGNAFLLGKNMNLQLADFNFDTGKMNEMGCRFIFSAGEIVGAEEHNLTKIGSYESPSSFWRIWVYELNE